MEVIYLITYVIFFFINCFIYKKKLNFVNVIISIWFICSIASMQGFYDMIVPPMDAYIYIFAFLAFFEVFCIIFYCLKYKIVTNNSKDETINWKLFGYIIFFIDIIMMFYALKGVKIYLSEHSFGAIRDAYLNYKLMSNQVYMFMTIIIMPLATAIGLYSIIHYIDTKKINVCLLLYMIYLVENLLTTAARGTIVMVAVFAIIVLFDKYKNNVFKMIKHNQVLFLVLGLMFIGILMVTMQRNLFGKGFVYNVYAYFVGSIHLFGIYVSNPAKYLLDANNLLFGQVAISGFFYPITFIMRLMGSNIKAGVYQIKDITSEFTPISKTNTTINNNTTFLYSALRDFGEWGILIYSVLLAFLIVTLYKRKNEKPTTYNRALFYYMFYNLIFLIFEFDLALPTTIFVFIYLWLLTKFNKKEKIDG